MSSQFRYFSAPRSKGGAGASKHKQSSAAAAAAAAAAAGPRVPVQPDNMPNLISNDPHPPGVVGSSDRDQKTNAKPSVAYPFSMPSTIDMTEDEHAMEQEWAKLSNTDLSAQHKSTITLDLPPTRRSGGSISAGTGGALTGSPLSARTGAGATGSGNTTLVISTSVTNQVTGAVTGGGSPANRKSVIVGGSGSGHGNGGGYGAGIGSSGNRPGAEPKTAVDYKSQSSSARAGGSAGNSTVGISGGPAGIIRANSSSGRTTITGIGGGGGGAFKSPRSNTGSNNSGNGSGDDVTGGGHHHGSNGRRMLFETSESDLFDEFEEYVCAERWCVVS